MSECLVTGTVSQVAVGPRVNGPAQRQLQLLVAGEVQGVCRTRPYRRGVQPSHWPPDTLGGYDSSEGVHHVPVPCGRVRLQALHPRLPGVMEQVRGQKAAGIGTVTWLRSWIQ